MTEQHTIKSVEQHQQPPHWRVFYEVPGGDGPLIHCHAFPPSTLAWRAAEYGIDPADSQTLLDIVLHEPHMTGHDHTSPDFLYNTDRATARKALHGRVAEVKTRVQIRDPHGRLAAIHAAHAVDPADHAAKCALVDHVREHGQVPERSHS